MQSQKVAQEKIRLFFEQSKPVVLPKNSILIQSFEDVPENIFYLKKGLVRMYCFSPEGEALTLHIFTPGSFFPIVFSFSESPNSSFFESMTPITVYKAPRKDVMQFVQRQLDVLFYLTTTSFLALEGYTTRIRHMVFNNSYQRTAVLLVYLADKFGEREGASFLLPHVFTHELIASWVGITRVSVSKAIGQLKKKGIVTYSNGKLQILDMGKINKEAAIFSY